MTTPEINAINRHRFEGWTEELAACHATAAFMVGIGHDFNSGCIHLFIPENLPPEIVLAYMRKTVAVLENQTEGGAN